MLSADYSDLVLLVIVVTTLVITLRVHERVRRRTFFRDRLRLVCPVGKGVVECTLLRDRNSGAWLEVERCSAFARPREIACSRRCLPLLDARHGPWKSEGPQPLA